MFNGYIGWFESIDTGACTVTVRYEDRRVCYDSTEPDEITLAITPRNTATHERYTDLRARLAGEPITLPAAATAAASPQAVPPPDGG